MTGCDMGKNNENSKLIIQDELTRLTEAFQSTHRRPLLLRKHNTESPYVRYDRAVIISDGSYCGILAAEAYKPKLSRQYARGVVLCDVSVSGAAAFADEMLGDNVIVYVFVDSGRHRYSAAAVEAIKRAFAAATRHRDVRFVVSLFVPAPKGLPTGVKALAEREYDYFLEKSETMAGPARDYALELNAMFRSGVRELGLQVTVLRSVNMFGPKATGALASWFRKFTKETFAKKRVKVGDADYSSVINITLPEDVVSAAFWAVRNSVPGHEFNVVSFAVSMSTLKRRLFESFPGQLSISDTCSAGRKCAWRCLSGLKFEGTRWRKKQAGKIDLGTAIRQTVCYDLGLPFAYGSSTAVYEGKLPQIKAVEMQILREIDRICQKHDIKYFLAGGTLLGAVRNGASIPWDDDFDIGFLRKDFDRFRKACDEELDGRFVHSCHYNGTNSHYMVDKIRMRNTYFSTRYSSIHAVEDGVFIDCLVYDATFENRLLAKVHDKLCGILGNLVQAYWREYRRDEVKTRFRWLLIRGIRIFPIGFYHAIYEWMIALCRRASNPSRLIDSMGKHIGLGTIPSAGLDDVRRVPFDGGFQAPIPKDPTGYLVYDYGKGYLPWPPYCKRKAPHNFARIDLGAHLFDPSARPEDFRAVDLRGELYEKEV